MESLMAVVDIACPPKKSLFSAISLSIKTVTKRFKNMSADVSRSTCTGLEYSFVSL